MKKLLFLFILSAITLIAGAQNVEVRLKGGINIQNSKMADKDVSTLPHFGISAGLRISTFGIYGELMYSTHEDPGGSTTLDYIIPSANFRLYTYRFIYTEAGLAYAILSGDYSGDDSADKDIGYYAGLGATFKRFELGLRGVTLPVINIQVSAAYRF